MASTATTSGGWSTTPSPYLGASGTSAAATPQTATTVGDDGNVSQPSTDVGNQLGQALSAYHLHQTANSPYAAAVNSQGYGAAAATANNEALGAALNAGNSGAPTPSSYAAPKGYNRLGIAIPTVTGAQQTGGTPATTTPAQSVLLQASSAGNQYAVWNPNTQSYEAADAATNAALTKADTTNYAARVGAGGNVNAITGPTLSQQAASTMGWVYPGTTLAQLNSTTSAQQATQQANQAALASGYASATNTLANTDTNAQTVTDPTVNSNQDFINQLAAQMGNINSAAGVQAADQTSANTQSAINSQLSTSGYQSGNLGAAARYGAGAAVAAEGQGALSHEQAAANAYDADFAQLGQAASQQLSLADSETQQQATQSVQAIQDELNNYQQQLGQLDTTTANQVTQHIASLQNQISTYLNDVQSYTGAAQQNTSLFKSILQAAATVAAIAT